MITNWWTVGLNVSISDWTSARKLQDQQRFTMALTNQNPFGLTLIQCHTPFVPTGTATGRLAEFDLTKTQTTAFL